MRLFFADRRMARLIFTKIFYTNSYMKKRFMLVAAALCLLTSVISKAQMTPVQFNDKLVGITEQLYEKGGMWGQAFNDSYKQKDFTLLSEPRRQLQAFVAEKLIEVASMKDVNNSRDLREAMIAFLRYEQKMITEAIMPVEQLGKNPGQEAVLAAQKFLYRSSCRRCSPALTLFSMTMTHLAVSITRSMRP